MKIKCNASEVVELLRTPRRPLTPLSYVMGSEDNGLSLDRVIEQLNSIQDNAACFIASGSEDCGIWQVDVKACDIAIAVLAALRDAGVNSLAQVRELAAGRQTEHKGKLAVVSVGTELVQCLGVFDDRYAAYGRALAYLSDVAECEESRRRIVPLMDLEDNLGESLVLETADGKIDETVYILRVQGQTV